MKRLPLGTGTIRIFLKSVLVFIKTRARMPRIEITGTIGEMEGSSSNGFFKTVSAIFITVKMLRKIKIIENLQKLSPELKFSNSLDCWTDIL